MEVTAVGQRFKVRLPVEIDVHGVDDQVKLARQRVQRLRIAAVHHFIRPHCQHFFLFRRVRAERRDFTAHRVQQLNGNMPQSADTDDADAAGSGDMVHQQRLEDGDAATQQRTGGFDINAVRQRDNPLPVGAQFIGKTTFVENGGNSAFEAVDLIAADTGIAVTTAACRPANAHSLAHFQPFVLRGATERHDAANNFVPGNQRIAGEAPFVVDHREIRVADPAVINLYFDVFCF